MTLQVWPDEATTSINDCPGCLCAYKSVSSQRNSLNKGNIPLLGFNNPDIDLFLLSFVEVNCACQLFTVTHLELPSTLFYCCPVCNQGTYQKPFVMRYWSLWGHFIFFLSSPHQEKVRVVQGQLQNGMPLAQGSQMRCSRATSSSQPLSK